MRSFQPDPAGPETVDLETFAVDRDVVVVPAEGDQIFGVGVASS